MSVICFIPARGGSKGIPNKNLRFFGNKPLIAHTIETAVKSKLFEHVIVSTEDLKIASISEKFGAEVPFKRPKKLATDTATFDDVLLHSVKTLLKKGYKFDIVASRDCTVPFIDKNDMIGAIKLLKKSNCDSVFTVCESHPNPYFGMFELNSKKFLIPSKKFKQPIKRRQDAPKVYELNGLYVNKVARLLKTEKMFSSKMLPYEIPKEHGFMIDYEYQFKMANLYFSKNN